VGEPAEGSRSPAPTVEEILAQMERQPLVAQESTEPAAAATEEAATTRRGRRRLPRQDWSTSPVSSALQP
jgi:hypothetical protein